MSKSLKTIQTFAKIGKVIANIVFIFSIIGAIASIIAVSTIASIQNLEFEGQTVVGLVESSGVNFVTTVFAAPSYTTLTVAPLLRSKEYQSVLSVEDLYTSSKSPLAEPACQS